MDENVPNEAQLRMAENIRQYYRDDDNVLLIKARVEKDRVRELGGLAQAFEKEKPCCVSIFFDGMAEKGIKREDIADVCVIPMWELMEKDASAYYLPVEMKASFIDEVIAGYLNRRYSMSVDCGRCGFNRKDLTIDQVVEVLEQSARKGIESITIKEQ